jgi:RNA polymerase sigma factor (sigma-70 family)
MRNALGEPADVAATPLNHVVEQLRRTGPARADATLSDAQLLKRFIDSRDEAAFAGLVRRHGPMVLGVCRRVLANHHDAEDAFQATFLVLFRKAASILKQELVVGWLYSVAYLTAMKARALLQKRARREKQVTTMPEPIAVAPDLWNDLQPLLDRELSRLGAEYRIPVILCDLEGKTRTDAARLLGLAEGTLSSRLSRARALLAKRLTVRGVTVSAGTLAVVLAQGATAASVPAALLAATVKATGALAGKAMTGAASARATLLMERVMMALLLTKLKVGAALALMLAVFGVVAGGGLVPRSRAQQGESSPTEARAEKERRGGDTDTKSSKEPWSKSLAELIKELKDKDRKVRENAARAIGRMGAKARPAVPALREAMEDHAISIVAAGALWRVDRVAFSAILKAEKGTEGRWAATLALQDIGTAAREVTPVLAAIARDERNSDRPHALAALVAIGADLAVALPILTQALGDSRGQYARIMAAQALGMLGPKARAALPDLHKALKDEDSTVRVDAAGAIWRIDKQARDIMPVLMAALKDSNAAARHRAMVYLARIGPPGKAAWATLLAAWQDPKDLMRDQAALALKAIDPKAAATAGVK